MIRFTRMLKCDLLLKRKRTYVLMLCLLCLFSSCSYNPFISNNHTTGNPVGALVGAGVGAGSVALAKGPKPVIALAGIGGGMLGYYVTTLQYDAEGIVRAGGQVYTIGDYVGIYIPSDRIFEVNTANFLPQAGPILRSIAAVLERFPSHNILISGNTSGFYMSRWEQKLSERRAMRLSAYLWNAGINQFEEPGNNLRKLNYIGYGDYFPIASTLSNNGIRQNSRIQITVYPSGCNLNLGMKARLYNNISGISNSFDNLGMRY